MYYERHSHSFGISCRHLQFTPKYRRPVFEEEILRRFCRGFSYLIAGKLGIRLVAVNFGPDHMHIFLGNCKHYPEEDAGEALAGCCA